MICDTLEHLTLYQGFHKNLDTAITFLMACDLNTLPLGRTEVDGDTVFINVMDAELHPNEGSHPEYHRIYADLQIDLTGSEGWGYETAPGTEVKPYAPDIGFQDSPDAVFGTLGGVTKQINTPVPEPVLLGKYLYSAREGILYDLEAGREAAALTLPETVRPKYWTIQGDAIWFYDAFAGEICRWDYAQSASFGKDGAVTVRYTANAPDENGLETCRREAARLNKAYGVNIVFWDELPIFPENVEFEKEYQIPAIRQALADLDATLARFPEDFLLSLGEKNADGTVNIAIVRSFPNGSDSLTVWPEASAWMLLAVGEDLTTEFYKNLSYVLDNYIIAHSLLLDDWNKLNPDGFRYSLSRTPVADAVTEGDNAAFLNPAATTYPRQDRAELFAYAMMAEAGEKLESPALHAKLEALCKAIRDAFGWQDLDITFPWEQPL